MKLKVNPTTIVAALSKDKTGTALVLGEIFDIVAIVAAVKGTVDAKKILDENKPSTKRETIKLVYKCYIPTVILKALGSFGKVKAHNFSTVQVAALTTVASIAEDKLSDYKEAIVSELSPEQIEKVENKMSEKQTDRVMRESTPDDSTIISTDHGRELMFDMLTGRYFYSNPEFVRSCVNTFNESLTSEGGWKEANDLYDLIGLDEVTILEDMVWTSDDIPKIRICSGVKYDVNKLCWVVDFYNPPVRRPEW